MNRFLTLVAPLRTPADAEADAGFRAIIVRQTRWGMVLASVLGVIGAAVFVGMQVLSGRRLALAYPEATDAAVVVSDDLVIVGLCLFVFVASRSESLVARWGRPLLAAVLVASATSSMIDDAARGDYTFSIAWVGLMTLVVVTAVPFRPRQALAMWATVAGIFAALMVLWPDALDTQIAVDRLAYAVFSALVVTCLSALLYAARWRQYQAYRRADGLRARLEARSGELEESMGRLAAAQARVVHAEKMAALGQFTSGLAHELQNPLNFVRNFAELSEELAGEVGGAVRAGDADGAVADLDDLASNLALIRKHGERASAVVQRMREHTGERRPPVPVRLNELAAQAVEAAPDNAAVEAVLADDVPAVAGSPRELSRALAHLVENAVWAAAQRDGRDGAARVTVETEACDGCVRVRVSDNGPGIPDAVGERVFEPFFTTRPTGEGTGLGLSLAYDTVVQGHGGELWFETEPGAGTTFVTQLPVEPEGEPA